MKRASSYFSAAERQRIEETIRLAEEKTSAEIVTAVATASGRYDRSEDIVGLWVAVLAVVAVWFVYPQPAETPDWGLSIASFRLPALIAAMIVGFVAGAALATYLPVLGRPFTPRRQMIDEVDQRARQVFFDARIHHTVGGSGLLIYLSLYERLAVLLADQAVVAALPQDVLDGLCRNLTQGLHDGRGADAVCAVVQEAADRLAQVLPRAADDVDELANHVVVID
jgi:putative membrane protein